MERFHEEGARIAVLEKSPSKASALRESHPDIVVVEGDCSRLDPNQRAVDETLARFGRLDVFIGNAGVWDNRTGLLQLEPTRIDQAFDEVFSVSVRSLVLGARAAQALLESRGSMIFTLSNASFHTGGGGPLRRPSTRLSACCASLPTSWRRRYASTAWPRRQWLPICAARIPCHGSRRRVFRSIPQAGRPRSRRCCR